MQAFAIQAFDATHTAVPATSGVGAHARVRGFDTETQPTTPV